jgi:hypothetical protein
MMTTLCMIILQTALVATAFAIYLKIKHMPISQQQFDQDLAALVTAVTDLGTDINNLITAITNWQNAHTGVDLTAEDQSVLNAAQALATSKATVDTEIQNLTPPPSPAPGP